MDAQGTGCPSTYSIDMTREGQERAMKLAAKAVATPASSSTEAATRPKPQYHHLCLDPNPDLDDQSDGSITSEDTSHRNDLDWVRRAFKGRKPTLEEDAVEAYLRGLGLSATW